MVQKTDPIRKRAYALWERAGRPDGGSDDFWFQAEQELTTEGKMGDEAQARSYLRDIDTDATSRSTENSNAPPGKKTRKSGKKA